MHRFAMLGLLLSSALLMADCDSRHQTNALATKNVTGVVREVRGSMVSEWYVTILITFQNSAVVPIKVVRYEVSWNGGQYTGDGPKEAIPAGANRDFRVTIYPGSGDFKGLSKARVSVLEARIGR